MILTVLLAAAVLSAFGFAAAAPFRSRVGLRPDGAAFVGAVLLPLVVAWWFAQYGAPGSISDASSPDALTNQSLWTPELIIGWKFALLTLGVYVLSVLRVIGRFPVWVADVLVLGAAWAAVKAAPDTLLSLRSSSLGDAPPLLLVLGRHDFTPLLAVVWVWAVARMSASLSRLPAVPSGYIGLVAGLVLLLAGGLRAGNASFAPFACAGLYGAGLTIFVLALKQPTARVGWAASLAGGFLLGIASAQGALNTTLPAALCFAALALGLPIVNFFIVGLRYRIRGKALEPGRSWVRLDYALSRRGVPPRKIASLFFGMSLWSCALAFFALRWFFGSDSAIWGLLHGIVWLLALGGGALAFFSLARVQMRRRMGEVIPPRLEAFGIEISPVSMREALDQIEDFIASGRPHHVVTSDANAVLTSRDDPDYTQIVRRAALVTPDGFGLVWGARLLGLPIYERVTGVDMVTGICERAARNGHRLYILGSEDPIAETAARKLAEKYPGATFVGTHHGYWRREGKEQGLSVEEADARMADEIRRATPDVLFVAMGIPMQEKFISAQMERMNVPVSLGVGGSFDVYSGKFNRAPVLVQRIGMEWLYRVWIDPSRWKRMGYVPKFMLIAIGTWLTRGKTTHPLHADEVPPVQHIREKE